MIWRWFWREWRSPSLLIVSLALTLSVASVLALGNISDRLNNGLNQQSRDFIAGDRVLRTARPVPEPWLLDARQQRLQLSRQLSFTTMTYAGDMPQLANVKATDMAYPLYGKLETRPANLKATPGTVLVAPRLLTLLESKVGDNLAVGDTTLRITGEIIQEPDAGFNPFRSAPSIIINLDDVDKTGAVQPGSRLTYRYMFAGSPQDIQRYEANLKPQLEAGQRWYGQDNDTTLGKSLQRSQQFLLLCALLTLLLSITAVAVAMSHYCRSRYDLIALLKTLGAGRKAIARLIIGQWLAVLLLAASAGSVIGWGIEALLLKLLAPVLPGELPAASMWPWLWAMVALVMISLLVGLRPYRQLLTTQPLRVFRHDVIANVWPLRYFLPVMLLTVVGVLVVLMGSSALLWAVLAGILTLALLLAGIGWGALLLLRRMMLKNLSMRLAVNRLLHQPWVTLSQLAAFSLSFMLLALLLVLRGDLLDRWQRQLPPDSPNYFLLNMTTAQLPEVQAFLQQQQLKTETFYPIVRARLTAINQQPATERVHESDPGAEAVNRELNLTWQTQLPDHNPLSAGSWQARQGEVSMERGIAERLKVKLGDTLTFTGDSQSFTAKVTSLRQVDWESLKPNFYFIFPPGALDGQPQTWLTSFRYEGEGKVLAQLNRQFPTLSLIDISALLKQAGSILQQVSRALGVMVVLVVVCGGLLLMAQVQVGMQQRRQELVVYRVLGASKRLLRATLWCEFALLGLVAGIAAAIGAQAALWFLQSKVFDFPWAATAALWWGLPLLGALLLSLCGGWLGVRLLRGQALFRRYQD